MKNLAQLLFLLLMIGAFYSCERTLIGEDPENTPQNNFELFWNEYNERYGLFHARGSNWDSIYQVYRPLVNSTTSMDQLFDIFSEMVDYLDDSHVSIFERRTGKLFISGFEKNEEAKEIMDRKLVEESYLKEVQVRDEANLFVQSMIKDKPIGYIYWKGVESYHDDMFAEALTAFNNEEAIIIDLRSNRGGDGITSRRIAGRFSDGEHFIHTVKNKIGPGENDFSEPIKFFTEVIGDQQWTKPVILLTNRASISAAEDFTLNMKAFSHVTQIGDITAGDFSNTSLHRFFPNGIETIYSTQWYQLPDGSAIDGIGNIPDIEVINKLEDVQNGIDEVLETAIQFLKDEYGIG